MRTDPVEVRQEFAQIEALCDSAGWEWLRNALILRRDAIIAGWRRGGHDVAVHERSAAQVDLLEEILELPQARAAELSASMHESITKPVMFESDPVDRDPLSPVPDEPDYDYREAG